MKFRLERDYLGAKKIPAPAYYGVQSQRAHDNFPICDLKLPPIFTTSYALIKKAATETNRELDLLDHRKAAAIIRACNEMISGRFKEEIIVGAFQAGAGTSQNMNVNEVIANRAIE
ncbi:MAG: lyase family protein, partial [Acidobacteriota bacterium]